MQDRTALRILLVSLLVRAFAAAMIGPGFDEAYYHLYARHLAPGYFDHPPLVAITAGLGWWLTGWWHPLMLRFGALLWFSAALLGFRQLAGDLYGRRAGHIAMLLPHATPFFTFGAGAFVIPDNALIAIWIWSLWTLWKLRSKELRPTSGFFALGGLLGLALLAKYHAVLLVASFGLACLFDPELRRMWRNWRLYASIVVAIIVFLPTILWNANNGWISFTEQFGKGTSGGFRVRFDLLGQAIGGQLGYLLPWSAVILWIGGLRARRDDRSDGWLISFFLVPVIGMTLIGLTRGILPHWTMPGYVAAIILTSGWMTNWSGTERFLRLALPINAIVVALLLLQAHSGVIPIPERGDPTLDPVGWHETLDELERRGKLQPDDVIFAHKWFTAAELAWADRGRHDVVLLGDRPHNFAWWAPEVRYEGRSGVAVTQERYRIDADSRLMPRFVSVEEISLPERIGHGRNIEMRAWKVSGFLNPIPPPYGPESGDLSR
jgi:hypothetical protein